MRQQNTSTLAEAAAAFKEIRSTAENFFGISGRAFKLPDGAKELIEQAKQLYGNGLEAKSVERTEEATHWINNVLRKQIAGAVVFMEDRALELQYNGAIEQDLKDNASKRMLEFEGTLRAEINGSFQIRIEAYRAAYHAVLGAAEIQRQRDEHRAKIDEEKASKKEQERRRRKLENQRAEAAKKISAAPQVDAEAVKARRLQAEELFG